MTVELPKKSRLDRHLSGGYVASNGGGKSTFRWGEVINAKVASRLFQIMLTGLNEGKKLCRLNPVLDSVLQNAIKGRVIWFVA